MATHNFRQSAAITFALVLFNSAPAAAEFPAGPSLEWAFGTVQVENDLFANAANTDRHYTNGLQASVLSHPLELTGWQKAVATARVPFGLEDARPKSHRVGLALGHSIFTPDDTDTSSLIANDRPYAAWLHLTFTLETLWSTNGRGTFQDQWKFDVGVVGPAAAGEFVQNNWHQLIGADDVAGWDNQLRNEPALNVTFERAWNSPDLAPTQLGGFQIDGIPYIVAALGNVQTYAGGGGIVRFGPDLPDDFGPARIYPGVGGSEQFIPSVDGIDWYLFAGAEGRVVGRDMFLDGNLFRDSHSVDKRNFVSDLRLGAVAIWGRTRVSFTHVYRTKEYSEQPKPDQFGAVTLGFAF